MRRLSIYGPSLIVLATALLVLFVGPGIVQQLTYRQTKARMIQATNRLAGVTILEELNRAFEDVAEIVEPSVVYISATQEPDGRFTSLSSGSGWIYDADGHVVTNHHVIKDAARIEVQLASGELRDADVLGYDETTDVAVLAIAPGMLHPAIRADLRNPVRQGTLVFAFGSPFDFRFSMSAGIVSGKGRTVGVLRNGYEDFIQVDAAINPGNSGGPLTDHRGHVIGMNTAIATGRRSAVHDEGQFAGIGLAIPLEMIEPVVEQIIDKGTVDKGFLGVGGDDLTPEQRVEFALVGGGVLVTRVDAGGPADLAGLRVRDILTTVNGKPCSWAQLRARISSMRPGDTAELTALRPDPEIEGFAEIRFRVVLGRLDRLRANGILPPDDFLSAIPQMGIAKMMTATPQETALAKVPFHEGVLIEEIVPGSRLARRLDARSIVIDVWDRPVTSVEEFLDALRDTDLVRGARVQVIAPDQTPLYVFLRVEE